MTRFHKVTLEIVRPGPPHNQLLSPLTPYMALCGEGSPITFHINLEHHKLVSRLQQLRYLAFEGGSIAVVPNRMREAAVIELAETVGGVLTDVRTLLAEVWRAHSVVGSNPDEEPQFVHLRLVLGGSELSLIPFEMALAPPAMPGEGLELSLQLGMPVVPTREIRSSRLRPISWNRSGPRVLLVGAAPGGLQIPLSSHVHALRAALEPWIKWPEPMARNAGMSIEELRLPYVRERLRVLTDASVEDIYEICSREAFTHIHILAHGDHDELAGEQRFGIALCSKGKPSVKEVVSGKRLASALQAEGAEGARRSQPLVVTLATCDSGNPGSVLVPGGSVAHDLHAAGIPWVFASQFPLTVAGSVRMTEALYPRLLRGDDPRQVIYEVRRQLYMSAQRDHDWASLVVYASVPEDLQDQVADFFERQARGALNVGLERADAADQQAEAEDALGRVTEMLDLWEARLPRGTSVKERSRRAECYGMKGSTFKRIAVLWSTRAQREESDAARCEGAQRRALDYYRKALNQYRRAMNEGVLEGDKYHWTATQALSVAAFLGEPPDPVTLKAALEIATHNLKQPAASDRAWAHGSLAELEMLRIYHAKDAATSVAAIKQSVFDHCNSLVDLMGFSSFHVQSTRRQFERYLRHWRRDEWNAIAEAAVKALSPSTGEEAGTTA
jgi:hypothetical protein